MTYRIHITRRARRDTEEAFLWLAERSPQVAGRWYSRLTAAILSLAEHPLRCALAPERERFTEDVRQLLSGKRRGTYRILFIVREDCVYVLHVRHSARNLLEPGELDLEQF